MIRTSVTHHMRLRPFHSFTRLFRAIALTSWIPAMDTNNVSNLTPACRPLVRPRIYVRIQARMTTDIPRPPCPNSSVVLVVRHQPNTTQRITQLLITRLHRTLMLLNSHVFVVSPSYLPSDCFRQLTPISAQLEQENKTLSNREPRGRA